MAKETKPTKKTKKSLIRDAISAPEIPEIEYNIEEQEIPELTKEQIAKNRLATTGPVVRGKSGRIGTSIEAPAASPNISAPEPIGQDFNAPLAAGQEKQQRMVQQPSVNTGVQPSGNAQQQEKMQGIESKQAYDEAGAASRIAAGQERVDRTVQPQQPVEQPAANTISDKQNAVQPGGNELLMDKNGNFIGVYGVTQPGDNTQKPTVDAGPGWQPYANTPEQQEYINNGGAMLGAGKQNFLNAPFQFQPQQTKSVQPEQYQGNGTQPVGADHYAGVYQQNGGQQPEQPQGEQSDGTQPVGPDHYAGVYAPQESQDGAPTYTMDDEGNLIDANGNVFHPGDNTYETARAAYQQQQQPGQPHPSIWDNGFSKDAVKNSGLSIGEAVNNYNAWAKENGKEPLDIMDVFNMFNGKDLDKSVKDNELDEKVARSRERWKTIGNFLSHLGNFVGTLRGAPSQQLESGQALSKRQQDLRDRTMALREKKWQDYLSAYRQKQADELAKRNADIAAKKEEREREALENRKKETDLREARLFLDRDKFGWKKQMDEKNFNLKEAAAKVEEEIKRGTLSVAQGNLVLRELELTAPKVIDEHHQVYNNRTRQYEDVSSTKTETRDIGKKKTVNRGNQEKGKKKPNPMG